MSTADVRGRFIWNELLTTDTAGAAAFYPRVVPWRTQPSSMPGYTLWMAGQTQIGGLTALPQDVGGPPPHWLIYVGTPSVDASCLQAQGLGARVLKAPRTFLTWAALRCCRIRRARHLRYSPRAPGRRRGRSPRRAGFRGTSWRRRMYRPRCVSTASCSVGARGAHTTWAPRACIRSSSTPATRQAACAMCRVPPSRRRG